MPEAAEQRKSSDVSDKSDRSDPSDSGLKRTRSLTGFYIAICVVIVLGLFGAWFWRAYTVWWFDADEARRRQAEAAAQLGLPVEKAIDLGDGVKLELVLIPAGRFRMGSQKNEKDRSYDEKQHWVVITKPFYMEKYEVTQEQWKKVIGANPSTFKTANNPVEMISWDDSQGFLRKLNALGKERGQFRLPTEAEWEWACRAGTRTRFCSGDDDEALTGYAWFDANSANSTHPVGTRKPNAWGLYDMHGNVWEWCADWYGEDDYTKSPRHDPTGPITGSNRVSRGGSWFNYSEGCRSSYHGFYTPTKGTPCVGFRMIFVPAGH
jgi:formylglycine-generating enzyme required for sulfatase activity